MKPLVILCILLLCAFTSKFSHAFVYSNKCSLDFAHQLNIEKKQPPFASSATLYLTAATPPAEQQNELLFIEDEDQDETNRPSSPTRYFIAFYYSFILSDRYFIFSTAPSFYKPAFYSGSCKYITQRVLRI